MKNIGLILLAGLAMNTISPIAAQTISRLNFALRGDIGTTMKEGPEEVQITWTSTSGRKFTVTNKDQMKTSWTNYTINVPSGQQPEYVTVKYLNDKMWSKSGITYDMNVRLDMNNFLIDGVPAVNLSRWIDGPVFDSWKSQDDYMRMNTILNGGFAWNGDYNIKIPVAKPSTADCSNPAATNIVCFDLRGDIGYSIPGQVERVKIAYQTRDGKTKTVYADTPLTQDWEKFMVKAERGEVISRIIVSFLNDRVWNMNGVAQDRNVRFNVSSFEVDHMRIPSMTPYINGPRYDHWVKEKDLMRTGLVVGGVFAWQDDYWLNIPGPEAGCVNTAATGRISNAELVCFGLKGKAAAFNPSSPDFVEVSYKTTNNRQVVSLAAVPIGSAWQMISVPLPKGQSISGLKVKLLDVPRNITDPIQTGVDFDLTSVAVNGQRFTDVTECYDEVPIVNKELNINF